MPSRRQPAASPAAVKDWIRGLPKAELHLHLEGTISPETLVEMSQRNDPDPLTIDTARDLYRYEDFTGFLMAFKSITERLLTPEDYELITYRMMKSLAAQGVVHAEVYVSVGVIYYWRKVEFEPLFAGMELLKIDSPKYFQKTLKEEIIRSVSKNKLKRCSITSIYSFLKKRDNNSID